MNRMSLNDYDDVDDDEDDDDDGRNDNGNVDDHHSNDRLHKLLIVMYFGKG